MQINRRGSALKEMLDMEAGGAVSLQHRMAETYTILARNIWDSASRSKNTADFGEVI